LFSDPLGFNAQGSSWWPCHLIELSIDGPELEAPSARIRDQRESRPCWSGRPLRGARPDFRKSSPRSRASDVRVVCGRPPVGRFI